MKTLWLTLSFCLLAAQSWAVEFAIVQQALTTSAPSATQDFTSTGFGTPKCAIGFFSDGTAAGTTVDDSMFAVGFTDGTNHRGRVIRIADATAGAIARNAMSDTNFLVSLPNASSTIDGSATAALITDGIRLTVTDQFPAAWMTTVVLIGGSGVTDCDVSSATMSGALDSATTVTTGSTPSFVVTAQFRNNATSAGATPSLGIVVNDGSNTQRSYSQVHTDASNPTTLSEMLDTNSVARRASGGAGGEELQINNFTATGFDVQRKVAAAIAMDIATLAVSLTGISAKVVTFSTPTSNGNTTHGGAGWTPQFGLALQGSALAVDTVYSDGNAESLGLSAFTCAVAGSATHSSDDNVATSNTESLTDNDPIGVRKDGAAFLAASLVGCTTDGVTFNYGTVQGSAIQGAMLFVQESVASGGLRRRVYQ